MLKLILQLLILIVDQIPRAATYGCTYSSWM